MLHGLFDTHCHLFDKHYDENETAKIVDNAIKNNVTRMINVGVDIETSEKCLKQATQFDSIYCAGGLHPSYISKGTTLSSKDLEKIREWSNRPEFVGIGECGLDYYHGPNKEVIEKQKTEFIKQVKLSSELNLPLIIHVRNENNNGKAHADVIKILRQYPDVKGVIHCFQGSEKIALEYISLGYFISISGIVTFENAGNLKEIVEIIPLNSLLIETDSPYLTPFPHRGKKNFPHFVGLVAKEIARIKKCSVDQITKITSENAIELFNI